MAKVVTFYDNYEEKLAKAMDMYDMKKFAGKRVLIKIHVGEAGNKNYVDPKLAKVVIDKLKEVGAEPFLFDTLVLYPGPRAAKLTHRLVAKRHGFTDLGCPFVIGDKGEERKAQEIKFEIAQEVVDIDHMIVLSHGKGHGGAGYGGAIKNLGMGCVSKKCKSIVHSEISVPHPDVNKCTLCGTCEKVCKQKAIKVSDEWRMIPGLCVGCGDCLKACPQKALDYKEEKLNHMLAYATEAVVEHMKEILYINVLLKISKSCDCASFPGPIICEDVGIMVSDDMVSIDKASIDVIETRMGKTFKNINRVDPLEQTETAEKIGLGSQEYKIEKI